MQHRHHEVGKYLRQLEKITTHTMQSDTNMKQTLFTMCFCSSLIFILERVNVPCVTMVITTNPGCDSTEQSIQDENKPHTVVIHDLHTIGYMASLLMGWDCLPNYHGQNTIERWLSTEGSLVSGHHGTVNSKCG